MKRITLSIYVLLLATTLFAQAGCTDPQASNYDENAVENDGSCNYETTNFTPLFKTNLGPKLEEVSAFMTYNGRYFGLGDSGNPHSLYEFNPTTGTTKTIKLQGTENIDWESMTSDDQYIYVGDTGNNKSGNREDLVIYKFPKSDLDSGNDIPQNHIQRLYYHYEDQIDFSEKPQFGIRYDCEAIVAMKDSIYLFSKDWNQYKTRCYAIPKKPSGNFSAKLKDSLNVLGLVTDAVAQGDSLIVLLGSSLTGNHFLELLFDFPSHRPFSGNTRQIFFNHEQIAQPEAILLREDLSGFIGSEKNGTVNQSLFEFNIKEWVQNPTATLLPIYKKGNQLSLFPNPIKSGSLTIEIPTDLKGKDILLYWFDAAGKQLDRKALKHSNFAKFQIPPNAQPGIHYILMQSGSTQFVGVVTIIE